MGHEEARGRVIKTWYFPPKFEMTPPEGTPMPMENQFVSKADFDEVCHENERLMRMDYWSERLKVAETALNYAESLIREIFLNMRPRDFNKDWYDKAQLFLDRGGK